MAAQFTATKLPLRLGLQRWMYLAKSSFPVPLSPWMSTVARPGATWEARARSSRRRGSFVMIPERAPPFRPPEVGDPLEVPFTGDRFCLVTPESEPPPGIGGRDSVARSAFRTIASRSISLKGFWR